MNERKEVGSYVFYINAGIFKKERKRSRRCSFIVLESLERGIVEEIDLRMNYGSSFVKAGKYALVMAVVNVVDWSFIYLS